MVDQLQRDREERFGKKVKENLEFKVVLTLSILNRLAECKRLSLLIRKNPLSWRSSKLLSNKSKLLIQGIFSLTKLKFV